jgi:hypothetical protein
MEILSVLLGPPFRDARKTTTADPNGAWFPSLNFLAEPESLGQIDQLVGAAQRELVPPSRIGSNGNQAHDDVSRGLR